MKKLLIWVFVLVLAALAGGSYLYSRRQVFVFERLEKDLRGVLGSEIQIENKTLATEKIFSEWRVSISKMTVMNPESFGEKPLAVVQDIEVTFNPLAFFQGKWEIHNASAYLSKCYWITNREGVLNMAQLPGIKALTSPGTAMAVSSNFEINRLEFKYGKLYPQDLNKTESGKTETINFHGKMDVFNHVQNPHLLIQAPVSAFLNQMNQGSFGLPRGKLQESIRQFVS